jgi:hypothetical protein
MEAIALLKKVEDNYDDHVLYVKMFNSNPVGAWGDLNTTQEAITETYSLGGLLHQLII